jgi:hypothetical protein
MVPIVMGWGGGHPGTSPGSLEGKKILMTTYSEFKVAQDEIHVHVSARIDGAGPYAATIRAHNFSLDRTGTEVSGYVRRALVRRFCHSRLEHA